MDRTKPKQKLETWAAVTVAFIGAVFFATICSSMLPQTRAHDFLCFYTGGVLAKTDPAHLYDGDLQSKTEYQIAPEIPVVTPYVRPAFWALLYIPLTWLSLKGAFAVWVGFGILTAFAIWYSAFRRFGSEALVYCAFFVPLGFGIAHGQDTAFVTGIAILAFCAAERGRKVLCGVLLAFLLWKFHLFLLIPVVLLLRREWRILAGYVPAALFAVAVSVAMASPQSYIGLLRDPKFEAVHPSPELMVNVYALAINFGVDFPVVRILLILGVLATVLLMPKTASMDRWFWGAIAGGLLISPHTFGYDVAYLLAPILKNVCDAGAAPALRWISALAVVPFPYFMTLLPMPFSAGPALLITVLFLAICWPEWFERRAVSTAPAGALG